MELEVEPRRLRFRAPLRTAYGILEERELLVVSVRDRDGVAGVGEAAPLAAYDGVRLDEARAEVEACAELLAEGDAQAPPALRAACRARCSLAPAAAALDVALWDLEAHRAGRPLAELLGGAARGQVVV